MNVGWNLNDSTTFLLEQYDCIPPKGRELSEYTDSAYTEMEDLSSIYMNGLDVSDRRGHGKRQFHPSCTAFKRIANLPGPA